jgi:NADH-quinone oxidoreductase subunit L
VLLLIPLLPLVGSALNGLLGRRLPKAVSGGMACAAMVASFAAAAWAVWGLLQLAPDARVIDQRVFTWISSGDLQIEAALRLDALSALMILVVTGIGALIHIYSTAYMREESDAEYARYFAYLNLFAFFMLVLVLGANFPVMFVGWEGVGLCSYLLIGFWYQKPSAADAGKKAFIVNRVGDFAFILGMLLVFVTFGTLDFREVAASVAPLAPEVQFGTVSLIALLLFIGATGKSAQIPLYTWLPDAMEGPTPVSALIHAATMVTAGVYMIGRTAELFSHAPIVLLVVAVIGVLTALMAGTIALVQYDIKRVLAYSTVSQLGFMFLAMGVGAYAAGIFHLFTHAFFKALLFLGSGAVIHAMAGEQDIRRMGGLKRVLPITYWTFLVGALAISGVPLLSGFFSKDEILFRTFVTGHQLLWFVAVVTALLTAVYMFRLVFLTFHGEPRPLAHAAPQAPQHPEEEEPVAQQSGAPHAHPQLPAALDPAQAAPHLHDAPAAMAFALIVLAIGSVLAGYAGVPHALGGDNRIEHFLEPAFHAAAPAGDVMLGREIDRPGEPAPGPDAPAGAAAEDHTALELALMAISTLVALGGIGLAFFFFVRRPEASDDLARRLAGAHRVLLNKYYVDEAYDAAFVQPIKRFSSAGLWRMDAALVDGAVNGTGAVVRLGAAALRRVQTGSVRTYAGLLFFGVVIIVGYYLWGR